MVEVIPDKIIITSDYSALSVNVFRDELYYKLSDFADDFYIISKIPYPVRGDQTMMVPRTYTRLIESESCPTMSTFRPRVGDNETSGMNRLSQVLELPFTSLSNGRNHQSDRRRTYKDSSDALSRQKCPSPAPTVGHNTSFAHTTFSIPTENMQPYPPFDMEEQLKHYSSHGFRSRSQSAEDNEYEVSNDPYQDGLDSDSDSPPPEPSEMNFSSDCLGKMVYSHVPGVRDSSFFGSEQLQNREPSSNELSSMEVSKDSLDLSASEYATPSLSSHHHYHNRQPDVNNSVGVYENINNEPVYANWTEIAKHSRADPRVIDPNKRPVPSDTDRPTRLMVGGWAEYNDPLRNRKYYYNQQLNESRWSVSNLGIPNPYDSISRTGRVEMLEKLKNGLVLVDAAAVASSSTDELDSSVDEQLTDSKWRENDTAAAVYDHDSYPLDPSVQAVKTPPLVARKTHKLLETDFDRSSSIISPNTINDQQIPPTLDTTYEEHLLNSRDTPTPNLSLTRRPNVPPPIAPVDMNISKDCEAPAGIVSNRITQHNMAVSQQNNVKVEMSRERMEVSQLQGRSAAVGFGSMDGDFPLPPSPTKEKTPDGLSHHHHHKSSGLAFVNRAYGMDSNGVSPAARRLTNEEPPYNYKKIVESALIRKSDSLSRSADGDAILGYGLNEHPQKAFDNHNRGPALKCKFSEFGKRIKKQWDPCYLVLQNEYLYSYRNQRESEKQVREKAYQAPQETLVLTHATVERADPSYTKRKNVLKLHVTISASLASRGALEQVPPHPPNNVDPRNNIQLQVDKLGSARNYDAIFLLAPDGDDQQVKVWLDLIEQGTTFNRIKGVSGKGPHNARLNHSTSETNVLPILAKEAVSPMATSLRIDPRTNVDAKPSPISSKEGQHLKPVKESSKHKKEKKRSNTNDSNTIDVSPSTSSGDPSAGVSAVPVVESKSGIREILNWLFKKRSTLEQVKAAGIYKDEPVFGSSLIEIAKEEQRNVCHFVENCIKTIEKLGLDADGIYRISGNLSQIQKIRCRVDHYDIVPLANEKDVHVLTGCLKLFFRELQEPVFPYAFFRQAEKISTKNTKDKIRDYKALLELLPPPHYDTVRYLFNHLIKVDKQSKFNRMTIHSMSIVFGPTLFATNPKPVSVVGKNAKKDPKTKKKNSGGAGASNPAKGGGGRPPPPNTAAAKPQMNNALAQSMIIQGMIVEQLLQHYSNVFVPFDDSDSDDENE